MGLYRTKWSGQQPFPGFSMLRGPFRHAARTLIECDLAFTLSLLFSEAISGSLALLRPAEASPARAIARIFEKR
jgi:hypothetical protein